MTEKVRRYEKIDFLGEGQVRIDICLRFLFCICNLLYVVIYMELFFNVFCNIYTVQELVHKFIYLYVCAVCCMFQFATVYKAKDIETNNIVAVKKVGCFPVQVFITNDVLLIINHISIFVD